MRVVFTAAVLLLTAVCLTSPQGSETHIDPHHPYIRYSGRVDLHPYRNVRFDWPGIMLEANFEGTSCAIGISGGVEWYNVFIDGEFSHRFKTDSLETRYLIASSLPDTSHHLLITKRYELEGKITECSGLYLDSGKTLELLPPRPHYRIEFIGASTLIGFGNESKSIHCDTISDASNCYLSYGPITARLLGAEYSIIAATGRGLVRNYGNPYISSFRPFPVYYNRTLWNSKSSPRWNNRKWRPHVIVLTLGVNDFTTPPQPTKALFTMRYYAFIRELYVKNPGVHIVCLTSTREPFRSYVETFVEQEIAEGNDKISFLSYDKIPFRERGCNWHPNVTAHRKIAEKLVTVIKPILETID